MTARIISAMIAQSDRGTERVVTLMRRQLIERIDDFRFTHRLPSRAEAIRQLIEAGLALIEADPARSRPRS